MRMQRSGQVARGAKHITDAVRAHHPFRKPMRMIQFAALARADNGNQPEFIGADARTADRVVANGAAPVLAQFTHDGGQAGKAGPAIDRPQHLREFVRGHGPVLATAFLRTQQPAAKDLDKQQLGWFEFRRQSGPRGRDVLDPIAHAD